MSLRPDLSELDPKLAELPPTEEQMAEIYKLLRMRDEPACCTPATRREADEERLRLWAA
jgi:hypothetical protein